MVQYDNNTQEGSQEVAASEFHWKKDSSPQAQISLEDGSNIFRQTNFKDFWGGVSRTNYSFEGLTEDLFNKPAFFNPLWSPYWLLRSWNNLRFLLLRPSLITLFYTTFHNKTLQNDWVCNCIWGTEMAFKKKKQKYNTSCLCTKMSLLYPWVLKVLIPRMSQIFLGKII